jgi:peptide/nickel transport system ATP-binding protein
MALSCRPEVLIADEPTTALDVTIQAQILDLLNRLQEEMGMAIMLITHDLGVVAEVADEVAVMYAGRIVESGPIRAIFRNPSHPYTAALLGSVPRMEARTDRLPSIEGQPPLLHALPVGCRFAPRCRFAEGRCQEEYPPAFPVGPDHEASCWRAQPS